MSPSLGTSKRGRRNGSVRGLNADKVQRETLHANGPLQRRPVKRAGENDISRRSLDRNVDGKVELVHAQIAADDRRGAALARESAGDRAVFIHGEVGSRLLGTIRRGVGKSPFSGDVAFRRLLWLLRVANFESAAVYKNHFDLGFFLEEVAIGNHKIRDFPVFN